ncbi:MAG TPA: phosphate-starvation-inducible PsiE family protein [Ktedonobacterales bacterium]|nr:phosphate-starvation-inducible PsiE family protein [Ktedonobacterales bacterium]
MIRRPRQQRPKDVYARVQNPVRRWSLRLLDVLDFVVYGLVGLAFVGAALLALGYSLAHLLLNFGVTLPKTGVVQDVQDVLNFVSDLLLVLIIMEVLGTVRSYLEKGDTSVKPFLFIGIISATRGILSIGARLSIQGTQLKGDEFRNSMIELGIDAVVIVALGITIRVLGKDADIPEDAGESAASEGQQAEGSEAPQ